jgi:hypothetical protein
MTSYVFSIVIVITIVQQRATANADHPIASDHVVFSVDGGQRVARQLASDYNLRYVSEVYSYIYLT